MKQLLENAAELFTRVVVRVRSDDLTRLHAKIGQQALNIDALSKALQHWVVLPMLVQLAYHLRLDH